LLTSADHEQGKQTWIEWREENPDIDPDLSDTELLRGQDLRNADLIGVNLRNADLSGANLSNADLN